LELLDFGAPRKGVFYAGLLDGSLAPGNSHHACVAFLVGVSGAAEFFPNVPQQKTLHIRAHSKKTRQLLQVVPDVSGHPSWAAGLIPGVSSTKKGKDSSQSIAPSLLPTRVENCCRLKHVSGQANAATGTSLVLIRTRKCEFIVGHVPTLAVPCPEACLSSKDEQMVWGKKVEARGGKQTSH
jgi:hypothetical protein